MGTVPRQQTRNNWKVQQCCRDMLMVSNQVSSYCRKTGRNAVTLFVCNWIKLHHKCNSLAAVERSIMTRVKFANRNEWSKVAKVLKSVVFTSHNLAQSLSVATSKLPAGLQAASLTSTSHIGFRVVTHLRKLGIPDRIVLLIISSLPVLELRGSIPIGMWMGLPLFQVFLLSVLGNLLPLPFLVAGLHHQRIRRLFAPLLNRAQRMKQQIADERFREIALALFVGVPLPGTGAWSGAMIAFVLDMPILGSFISITVGVLLAGIIMMILTTMGHTGAIVATIVLLTTGISALWRKWQVWRNLENK
eukprot:jgi/Galph1/2440/GphlegSOOS_G1106.1